MTKGIPTVYQHMRFRSRLEAKWAKFFDLCGWRWSYEPFDLDGWIPDFAIGDRLQTLVEIKPVMSVDEIDETTWSKLVRAAEDRAERGLSYKIFVFGADPVQWLSSDIQCGAPPIGYTLGNCDIHFGWTEGNELPGLCPMSGGWDSYTWHNMLHKAGRVSGGWMVTMDARTMLMRYWREACNSTQWMRSAADDRG